MAELKTVYIYIFIPEERPVGVVNGQRGLETVAVGAQSEHRLEFEPGAQCVCQCCGRNFDSYLSVRGQSSDACVKRVDRPTRVLDIYADIPRGLMCCSVAERWNCRGVSLWPEPGRLP